MGLFSFIRRIEKPERRRHDGNGRLLKRVSITPDRELYEELDFLHLLYRERRRSERFSRPLCLVLVEQTGIRDGAAHGSALRQIFDQLHGSIRETDVVGWYSRNSTLAIMFSDLSSAGTDVVNALGTKVNRAISLALPAEIADQIRMSVHLFPKKSVADDGMGDLTFYPELPSPLYSRRTAEALKRLIDVAGSTILLCLLGPVFAFVAAAIKVNSRGPIIFKQIRVGQRGKPFSFLKFRSMYIGSDATIHREYVTTFISRGALPVGTNGVYKLTNDPRVTAVGRWLRKTSLDELPQLWNVLCGDMSLVGPRPPIPYECECYALWHRRRVLEAKPGITGLWQVGGRSRLNFNDMVRLDLQYAKQWSIWLDIKILLQTPKAVLMGEGAY
jgi:lipopolysaccharide/colanic/teichoic acid biosynthesis glycosyltransferase